MKLEDALPLAEELRTALALVSERIEIAGSIRRRRPEVKDIELVAIPTWREVELPHVLTLFPHDTPTTMRNMLRVGVEALEAGGVLQVIKPGTHEIIPWTLKDEGKYWRCYVPEQDVKVDIFLPTLETWGLCLMIRTGSGVGPDGRPETGFGPAMLARWKKLNAGLGYSEDMVLHTASGLAIATPEEADVFRACKVEWTEPVFRTDARVVAQRSLA